MGHYEFINHTADVGVRITGKSMEELFVTAAHAWRDVVLGESTVSGHQEPSRYRRSSGRKVEFTADSSEELLVEFLGELNFLLTTKYWLCRDVQQMEISKIDQQWNLQAHLQGESLQPEHYQVQLEIKAITYHNLSIEETDGEYQTVMVFDI